MIYVASLASGLAASLIIALIVRDRAIIRGALALVANWLVLTAVATVSGDQYNVPLNMAVDWATIRVGFMPANQFPQVIMAILFGTGMMFHADHLFELCLGVPLEQLKSPYWWRFYDLSWVQIALMIGWGCHGGWRLFVRDTSRPRGLSPVPAECGVARLPVDGQ